MEDLYMFIVDGKYADMVIRNIIPDSTIWQMVLICEAACSPL